MCNVRMHLSPGSFDRPAGDSWLRVWRGGYGSPDGDRLPLVYRGGLQLAPPRGSGSFPSITRDNTAERLGSSEYLTEREPHHTVGEVRHGGYG